MGSGISRQLLMEGAKVVALLRREDQTAGLLKECAGAGPSFRLGSEPLGGCARLACCMLRWHVPQRARRALHVALACVMRMRWRCMFPWHVRHRLAMGGVPGRLARRTAPCSPLVRQSGGAPPLG